ncbi:Uncharacterised protein [Bordetella pertussis]|nr:Uncharacterised protein [Bordetella pertussis]CPN98552.1 Uncharacterised protein [Bordetella pertussis]
MTTPWSRSLASSARKLRGPTPSTGASWKIIHEACHSCRRMPTDVLRSFCTV